MKKIKIYSFFLFFICIPILFSSQNVSCYSTEISFTSINYKTLYFIYDSHLNETKNYESYVPKYFENGTAIVSAELQQMNFSIVYNSVKDRYESNLYYGTSNNILSTVTLETYFPYLNITIYQNNISEYVNMQVDNWITVYDINFPGNSMISTTSNYHSVLLMVLSNFSDSEYLTSYNMYYTYSCAYIVESDGGGKNEFMEEMIDFFKDFIIYLAIIVMFTMRFKLLGAIIGLLISIIIIILVNGAISIIIFEGIIMLLLIGIYIKKKNLLQFRSIQNE